MKLGDFIKSPFSTLINRKGSIFKALLADNGNGTMEKLISGVETCRSEWCNDTDFYNMSGERFEKCAALFSVLKRMYEESDESFKNRIGLLLHRNGDDIWGDKWNILHILQTYFDTKSVWIRNSTDNPSLNILSDPDFEKMSAWTLEGGAAYSQQANFSGALGMAFSSVGSCSQIVSVSQDTTYFLHFFVQGKINVSVRDNNGRYYCTKAGDFGAWQQNKCVATFSCDEWDAKSLFFITDSDVSAVTITFEYVDIETYLDYTRLFAMDGSITFSVIVQFKGVHSDSTLVLAPGEADPIKAPVLDFAGFFAEGTQDVREIDSADQSFYDFDSAAAIADVSPLLTGGEEDFIPTANLDGRAYIELDTWCMAGNTDGDVITIDYDSMSYYDNAFMYGATGTKSQAVYEELLEIMAAGGTTPFIELVTRESAEE